MCAKLQLTTGEWLTTAEAVRKFFPGIGFGGFARAESRHLWRDRVVERHWLPIAGFTERNEQLGTAQQLSTERHVPFLAPKGAAVLCVVVQFEGRRQVRIVTEPANALVQQISGHRRMPWIRRKAA